MAQRTCCECVATRDYLSAASMAESSLSENVRLLSAATASSTCATLLAPISEDVTTLLPQRPRHGHLRQRLTA